MITMCGYPCSGKSTRAQQLAAYLDRKLADSATSSAPLPVRKVVVINDEALSISKHAYDGQPPPPPLFSSSPVRPVGRN